MGWGGCSVDAMAPCSPACGGACAGRRPGSSAARKRRILAASGICGCCTGLVRRAGRQAPLACAWAQPPVHNAIEVLVSVTLEQVQAVHTVTELVHAILYLCPEAMAEFEALGLEPRGQGYVAGRAAPMGPIGPGLATATFFNFSPALLAYALPAAWEIASPDEVLAARFRALEAVFERVDAPTEGLAELTELARKAAEGLDFAGRPLAAANADVVPPETPFAAAWQALCVLREHRGDGHIAVLLAHDVSPMQALVLYAAWQRTVSRRFLQATRAREDDAWTEAEAQLRTRGLIDDDGALTDDGRTMRDTIERETDRLAAAPYETLGVDGTARLFELARPLAVALNENGGYKRAAPMADSFPA